MRSNSTPDYLLPHPVIKDPDQVIINRREEENPEHCPYCGAKFHGFGARSAEVCRANLILRVRQLEAALDRIAQEGRT